MSLSTKNLATLVVVAVLAAVGVKYIAPRLP